MARSPIALGLAQGRSKPFNAGRLVNLYAEQGPNGALSQWILYGTPGQKTWATVGSQTIRAMRAALGYLYVLSGTTLYRVDSNRNAVACTGATPSAAGTAQMDDNGVQLGLLVNGTMFYVAATSSTTLTQVTDPNFPAAGASSIGYVDGYGIFSQAGNSQQWFLSSLLDFSTYNATLFASKESQSDYLLRVLANHKEAWLFGSRSIEVWTDTGSSPFPFTQIPGSLMDKGIEAPLSAILMDNSVYWMGNDRMVYRANGYTPMRVSQPAVEEILRANTVNDAVAMTHFIEGHHFYVLQLPTAGRTLVLDAQTELWHERQSGTTVTTAPWSVNCIANAFDLTLVGGIQGMVNVLDLDTYMDGATQIRRAVTSWPVYPDGKRGLMRRVELECELGVGSATGQGINPQAMLRFSKDGGQTWSNEKWASFGPQGSYRKRCFWRNLGMFRNGVAEIAIADPVKVAIYSANYEPEGMLN